MAYFCNARLKVPCPTGEILEVRPRLVLVALQTVVETAVGLVVRLGGDVAEEADLEALLLRVEDVELPDGDAGRGEAKSHQAVVHQRGGHGPEEAAHPRVVLVLKGATLIIERANVFELTAQRLTFRQIPCFAYSQLI